MRLRLRRDCIVSASTALRTNAVAAFQIGMVWSLCQIGTAVPAAAIEPVTVRVEGTANVGEGGVALARREAVKDAVLNAGLEVARRYLGSDVPKQEVEVVREFFSAHAASFVTTYRVEGTRGPFPSPTDPDKQVLVASIRATLDAALVRDGLQSAGLLQGSDHRPSVMLRVTRQPPGDPSSAGSVEALRSFLARRLEAQKMVVIDTALRGPFSETEDPLHMAQELGADLLLQVVLHWQSETTPRGMAGGIVHVRVRALRVRDGIEIASARFDGPAYHEDPEEAFARAVDAVKEQVAQNLMLQLSRNWHVLARKEGLVHLRLVGVDGLLEVEAVQRALREVLKAEQSVLLRLEPAAAEIAVRGPFSPGALQDRLAAVVFDHFRLQPLSVEQDRIELRVRQFSKAEADPDASGHRVQP